MKPFRTIAPLVLLLATDALARVGGGQTYSGGGGGGYSGGSDSGGGGDAQLIGFILELFIRLIFYYPQIGIPLTIFLIYMYFKHQKSLKAGQEFNKLRKWSEENAYKRAEATDLDVFKSADPNFSSPMLLDFITMLYTRAYLSSGQSVAFYLSPQVEAGLRAAVAETVVIGGLSVATARSQIPSDILEVEIEANLHLNNGDDLFVVDRLTLQRNHGTKTQDPEMVKSFSCPNCGDPSARQEGGRCSSCGERVNDGRFAWTVTSWRRERSSALPPVVLSETGMELGTDLPTVRSPQLSGNLSRLTHADPDFDPKKFESFARTTFMALQDAWTTRDWSKVRPLETDFLFQQHQFWIDGYKRDGLQNVLEDIRITRVDLAKIDIDKFFETITLRIFAEMKDYTVRLSDNKVMSGNPQTLRRFSEYWTWVRRAGVTSKDRDATRCPNCGAPLDKVTQVGDCEYCQARITRGDFDWILSRIEQDETYR